MEIESLPNWDRVDAWQVLFVALNLAALGLTAWALDSVTTWGYSLSGMELVAAVVAAGVLVIGSVAGSVLLWMRRNADTLDNQNDAKEASEREETDDMTTVGDDGDTGQTDGVEPAPIEESGEPLPGPGSAEQGSSTGATSGNFAVEGFGPSAGDAPTPQDPSNNADRD